MIGVLSSRHRFGLATARSASVKFVATSLIVLGALGSAALYYGHMVAHATVPSSAISVQLTAGKSFLCGLALDSQIYCKGVNERGALGNAAQGRSPITDWLAIGKREGLAGKTVQSITAGYRHMCALTNEGVPYCWGGTNHGQAGTGSISDLANPYISPVAGLPGGTRMRSIVAGYYHTCAIATDSALYCWGRNASGQIGNGATTDTAYPARVRQDGVLRGRTIQGIFPGWELTCALTNDNRVACWGQGSRLGNGSTAQSNTPVLIDQSGALNGKTIRSVSVGGYHACVVTSEGRPYCWGLNRFGQGGVQSTADNLLRPQEVYTGGSLKNKQVRQVALGNLHSCALTTDNEVHCWGRGSERQLGQGSDRANKTQPTRVSSSILPNGPIDTIVSGYNHTCAVHANRDITCWGDTAGGPIQEQLPLEQNTYAVHAASDGAQPGQLLAERNKPATLERVGDAFRVRIGVRNTHASLPVSVRGVQLRLEYAEKNGATCATSTGWAAVAATTPIAYTAGAPSGVPAYHPGDYPAPTAAGYAYQSIISATGAYNERSIDADQTGLWDFALTDRSGKTNQSYCLRLVATVAGTAIDTYTHYPEVKTSSGELGLRFVHQVYGELAPDQRTVAFSPRAVSYQRQSATGLFVDSWNRMLEVHNSTSSGWSVSLAATQGARARWRSTRAGYSYAYNDNELNGRLVVDTSGANVVGSGSAPNGQPCGTNGVSLPRSRTSFTYRTSSVTLLSGSRSAQLGCAWRIRNVQLSQTIPARQPSGTYELDMTVTAVAQ